MSTVINFEIKEHLRPLFEDNSRHQVIVAHRRFGKTSYGIKKIILQAAEKPGSRYWYVAPTYKQAKMIAWRMIQDYCPKELIAKKNESELYLTFVNGSIIELKGSDKPDSLRGPGLDGLVLDEYSVQQSNIYTEILRPALADKHGWTIKIGTPKGKNHFYDDWIMTGAKYLFKASDTKIIDEKELDEARKEMSPDEYNQEFECEFLYFAGQIYKEFKEDLHVLRRPFKINDSWYQQAAIDHGQHNPACALFFMVDFDGRIFVFDEYYNPGRVSEHCQAIISKGHNLKTLPLLDASAFSKDREKDGQEYSIADEYRDNGVQCLPAQNNAGSVRAGINRVKEYFSQNKLFVFANCENLIRELQTYRWKDRKKVDANAPEEPLKVNDHACDALRYFVLSRPLEPKLPKYVDPLEQRRKQFINQKHRGDWYEN